jgi:tetratricopeptide (TPR) repeat protein
MRLELIQPGSHGQPAVDPRPDAYAFGCWLALVLLLLGGLAGCRSAPRGQVDSAPAEARAATLLEEQLLEVIAMEQRLDALAAEPEPDRFEVQRRFQDIARGYAAIIARNPDHLESRLLYGKLLMRYGDSEGAREQFLLAARIDPKVAVIHQQLSTYHAEEGDHTRALAYALNAVELEPATAAYHFGLGQLLAAFREELLADAVFTPAQLEADMLAAFRKAAELAPDTLPLQFRYGEAFYDLTEPDWIAALDHWQALAANPQLSRLEADAVRIHRARCLIELHRDEDARALLQAVESPSLADSAAALLDLIGQ